MHNHTYIITSLKLKSIFYRIEALKIEALIKNF